MFVSIRRYTHGDGANTAKIPVTAVVLTALFGAAPASAAMIDLTMLEFTQISTAVIGFGTGGVQSATFDRDDDVGTNNDITMSTSGTRPLLNIGGIEIGTSSSRLKGGLGGAGLVTAITGAEGVCAGGRGALTELDCAGPVTFDFGVGPNAVGSVEVKFEPNADLLDAMSISFSYDIGGGVQTRSGTAFELLDLGLLNVVSLGLGNFSGFFIQQDGMRSVTYSPDPLLGLSSIGGPVAYGLNINEAGPSAVPLPAAAFGLVAGMGAICAVGRRRRKRSAA